MAKRRRKKAAKRRTTKNRKRARAVKRRPARARARAHRARPAARARRARPRARAHRPARRSGLQFDVVRVQLDRQGYDPHGRYWGANTRGHKLYLVCVTDHASGTYRDAHLRAANAREAKAQAAASMVKALSGLTSRAA